MNQTRFLRHLLAAAAIAGLAGCAGQSTRPESVASAAVAPESDHVNDARTRPARAVLERLFGPGSDAIRLSLDASAGNDAYHVQASGGQVTVSGNSTVALTAGVYDYLKQIGAAQISWEGDRIDLPKKFPDYDSGERRTAFLHRAYLNVCTYGYTTPFWQWDRWQREIDWMAIHGVDMPLAMEGQEAIWQQLWREMGLSDAELADYFTGPAFTPWQRMGNIEGYRAPLPQAWIDGKRDLQKKILARMRSLGMKPVLPAFGGYVPQSWAEKHPEAHVYKMRAWEGFHATWWLDPADPWFGKIARRFIQLYDASYGPGQYYLADSFNEMLPPVSGVDTAAGYGDGERPAAGGLEDAAAATAAQRKRNDELAAYGAAIYRSIANVHPDATWVMQGWLFGADEKFWTPDAVQAFLRDVPDTGMMILDIGNDRYGVWKKAHAFYGKPWIYGYVHNYGGSNPVYGDFDFYKQSVSELLADPAHGQLSGFGVFPEGLDTNSVVYEYLYDLAWDGQGEQVSDWLATYTRARYGHTDARLQAAWADLQASVFSTRYWTPRWWNSKAGAYLLFKRPDISMTAYDDAPGDLPRLRQAVDELLAVASHYSDSPLFRHDLIEFARHYAFLRMDQELRAALKDTASGDPDKARDEQGKVARLAAALDQLLAAQPETLQSWVAEARADAPDQATARVYEQNARAQVTVWGGSGNLNDYASKAWSGLITEFYLPRWQRFLDDLRQSRQDQKPFDNAAERARLAQWESDWVNQTPSAAVTPPSDPVAAVRDMLAQIDSWQSP